MPLIYDLFFFVFVLVYQILFEALGGFFFFTLISFAFTLVIERGTGSALTYYYHYLPDCVLCVYFRRVIYNRKIQISDCL